MEQESIDSGKFSLKALFACMAVMCVPFATIDIKGIGVLLLITAPLLFLSIINSKFLLPFKQVPLVLFFTYGIISSFMSPSFSTNYLYQYIKIILLIGCIYLNKFTLKEQKLLILSSCISCVLICFFMLSGNSNIAYVEGRATISVFGASQDPNYIAYAFFFSFAVMLNTFLTNRKILFKAFSLVGLAIILYCVLRTGSRGSMISCAALIVVFSLHRYKGSYKTILIVCTIIVGVLLLYPFIIDMLPDDIARRFTYAHLMHNNGSNRGDIWITAIDALKSSPIHALFGYGSGSSVAVIGRATHNYILQILLENGFVGLILMTLFIVPNLVLLIKSNRTIALSVYVACLVMSLTLSVNTSYYFWVTLLLCIVCDKVDNNTPLIREGNL